MAFAASRLRFGRKLMSSIPDDPQLNRYYSRDIIGPRFFLLSLDDYVRAVSNRDWATALVCRDSVRSFARIRQQHGVGWKLRLIRSPRRFRWLLRLNERLPRRLRPTTSPMLRLRQSSALNGEVEPVQRGHLVRGPEGAHGARSIEGDGDAAATLGKMRRDACDSVE
jgi:hypothetical protein